MYLKELQENWNTFGEEDPLWAICSSPQKKHNQWDTKEFFSSGTSYVSRLKKWMDAQGYPKRYSTALDFGCGVGRLTQALCEHFDWCVGVDIAPSMIKKAKELNQHGKNCVYKINETDNLQAFPNQSFDLINTEHVLQHIHPKVALSYISEFIRILRPGGLAFFHCPSALATFAYPKEGITCTLSTTTEAVTMGHMKLVTIPILVTNTGSHPIGMTTDVNAPAKVWHHWSSHETGELTQNHGYTNIPGTIIEPGQSLEFEYKAASPATPGQYTLALTPADYFNRPISPSPKDILTIPVLVEPQKGSTAANQENKSPEVATTKRPHSESHAIPIEVVTQVVKAAGGRIIEVKTAQSYPGSVVRADYYVTR